MVEYFYVTLNGEKLNNVAGGRVDFNSEDALVQSASLKITDDIRYEVPQNAEIKIYHVLNGIESLMGTLIGTTPRAAIDIVKEMSIDCYSTLWLLSKRKLERRYTCKNGTQITNEIVRLLGSLGIKYTLDIVLSEKSSSTDIEFEIGTSYLKVFNTLLGIINYTSLFPKRDGTYTSIPYVDPSDRAVTITYNEDDFDNIVLPDFTLENDFYDIPNVFVRYVESAEGDLIATYENSNPDSTTSTVNAPRNPHTEEVRDVADLTTLYEIAKRDCIRATSTYCTGVITTAVNPNHWHNDMIKLVLGCVNDVFESVAWSMSLETGADMIHTIRKVVQV